MIIIFLYLVKTYKEKKGEYFYCYYVKSKNIIYKKENKN